MPTVDTSLRVPVGTLGEDALLARILPLLAGTRTDVVGPGDDAAVLDIGGPVVVTTDAMVRGRDWLDVWSTPEDVAIKCVTQNLADLAAMGAEPRSLLVTLVLDPQTPLDWVLRFAAQLGEQCRRYDVTVAGGDLSSADAGVLVVSVTAIGSLGERRPVLRSGAQVGDQLAVTGSIGRSGVGLALLQRGNVGDLSAEALTHHLRPSCPLSQGLVAAQVGASAMIDVSDGLARDLHRLARESGVAVGGDSAALSADLNWAERFLPRAQARAAVLGGGEEHSLIACFPGTIPPWWRVLGRVREGSGVFLDDKALDPLGWDHFGG